MNLMSETTSSTYSRKNPFRSTLLVNRKLTGPSSNKDTRHFELNLKDSGLQYEVGDSLGVFPSNDPELVDQLLHALSFSGTEEIEVPDAGTRPLRSALIENFSITEPSKQFLKALAERDNSAGFLNDLLDPASKHSLDNFLWGRDLLDLLEEFPAAQFTPQEFVKTLRKLQPRLYSIASSQRAVGENVHLTVAIVRFTPEGKTRLHKGVASTFLAERAHSPGDVPVFIHSAKHFRLPEDPTTDCLMVGPGTGVAPFRAFLQDRQATGASGRNWLFFGEQKSSTDFFYKDEFDSWLSNGTLTRLTTAFSRDQAHKIYVQHRLLENSREVYDWLENGAIFYVCGDAKNMAKDVDLALHQIIQKEGAKSPEQAAAYVDQLKKDKRYRKDVY